MVLLLCGFSCFVAITVPHTVFLEESCIVLDVFAFFILSLGTLRLLTSKFSTLLKQPGFVGHIIVTLITSKSLALCIVRALCQHHIPSPNSSSSNLLTYASVTFGFRLNVAAKSPRCAIVVLALPLHFSQTPPEPSEQRTSLSFDKAKSQATYD